LESSNPVSIGKRTNPVKDTRAIPGNDISALRPILNPRLSPLICRPHGFEFHFTFQLTFLSFLIQCLPGNPASPSAVNAMSQPRGTPRPIALSPLESTPSAAMLVDVPVGASPAGGACSVTTVGMPDNGKGDRPVESSGVKVSVGWGKARSDPPGKPANRQAVANSEPGKPRNDSPIGSG